MKEVHLCTSLRIVSVAPSEALCVDLDAQGRIVHVLGAGYPLNDQSMIAISSADKAHPTVHTVVGVHFDAEHSTNRKNSVQHY